MSILALLDPLKVSAFSLTQIKFNGIEFIKCMKFSFISIRGLMKL